MPDVDGRGAGEVVDGWTWTEVAGRSGRGGRTFTDGTNGGRHGRTLTNMDGQTGRTVWTGGTYTDFFRTRWMDVEERTVQRIGQTDGTDE